MANELKLQVNAKTGDRRRAAGHAALYVLTNDLGLPGPRFGCGSANAAPVPCWWTAWR